MKIDQLITDIEKLDPEVYDRLDSRRKAMRQFANVGGKIALTALPFALGGMFKKAYGGQKSASTSIVDSLNFALTLEYLESNFYVTGLAVSGLIPNVVSRQGIQLIATHETAHVAFLIKTIITLGGTPVPEPEFDFTAGGTYPDVFSNYDTFLALAQTFEDTGVRAYKGQALNLMSNNSVLTSALRIHSVEARHAVHLRTERSIRLNNENIKPWITKDSTGGIGASVQATYAGEDNTVQLGIQIVNINGYDISINDATEAFDEPLTMEQVLAIVDPFII